MVKTQLPLATLKDVKSIITHDHCADGMASALILHDALPDASIRFIQHGTEELKNLQAEPGMLFCDFAPPEARVQEFIDAGAVVLDHHKKQEHIVRAFGERGVFADEKKDVGVSGAVLAFNHVWWPIWSELYGTGLGFIEFTAWIRGFAVLAGIRDTWQKQSSRWREACAQASVLRFYDADSWLAEKDIFTNPRREWWEERMKLGEFLFSKQEKTVQKVVQKAYRFTSASKGTRVVLFEGVQLSSDAADLIDKEADLVVGFNYEIDEGRTKLILSTRSHTTFDCGAFSKSHGGGGHTFAAGFNIPFTPNSAPQQDPFTLVEALVNQYEQKGS